MANAALLINLALEATLQLQQYQLALAKAAAENRDVTNAELETAIQTAETAIKGSAMQIDAREFGEMKATVEHLSKSVEKLESAVERLTNVISELQGGKKLLFALSTGVGGIIGWVVANFKLK